MSYIFTAGVAFTFIIVILTWAIRAFLLDQE